jgi:hypothetical protein
MISGALRLALLSSSMLTTVILSLSASEHNGVVPVSPVCLLTDGAGFGPVHQQQADYVRMAAVGRPT